MLAATALVHRLVDQPALGRQAGQRRQRIVTRRNRVGHGDVTVVAVKPRTVTADSCVVLAHQQRQIGFREDAAPALLALSIGP